MTIDWNRLVRVRERGRTTAVDEARREAADAERRVAEQQQAEAAWAAQHASRQSLWTQVADTSALRVDELRDAATWSRRLDRHIAEAGAEAERRRAASEQQQRRVDESRDRVRRAAAACRRASEMAERVHAAQQRREAQRLDDVSEDVALRQWAARREVS